MIREVKNLFALGEDASFSTVLLLVFFLFMLLNVSIQVHLFTQPP